MKVWGLTVEQVSQAVANVSAAYYGNVCFKRPPEPDGRAVSFTLTVRDSRKKGARRSHTGRRISAACWHCFRDTCLQFFAANSNARVKSGCADYRGLGDFAAKFELTGDTSIGGGMTYREGCNCNE